jgi:isoprenylcysteine carboxyl methyltransferase (ICMT) family protein YpbQ
MVLELLADEIPTATADYIGRVELLCSALQVLEEWAMSPTEREWGEQSTKLEQCVHQQRNLRMIIESMMEDAHEDRAAIARLNVMLKTTLSVLAVVSGLLAWTLEMVLRWQLIHAHPRLWPSTPSLLRRSLLGSRW